MSRIDSRPQAVASARQAPAKLRTYHLVGLLIAAHTPLAALWAVIPGAFVYGQVVATPLMFLLAGLILLAFVLGYSGLGRRIRHRGGLYVQVVQGLGRPVGLGVAALVFVAYVGVAVALYGFLGAMVSYLAGSVLHVTISVRVSIILSALAILGLSLVPLKILARALLVVVVEQIFSLLWFDLSAVHHPAGGHVSYAAVDPAWILSGSFGIGLVFAVTAFIGSEAGTTYSEDLERPERSIPVANYISYAVYTAVLVVSGWAVSVMAGGEEAPTQAAQLGGGFVTSLVFRIAGPGNGTLVANLLIMNLIVGLLATGITLNSMTARLATGLARDGVLPAAFGIREFGRLARPAVAAQPVIAGIAAFIATYSPSGGLAFWLVIGSELIVTGVLTLASASSALWFLRGEADEGGFFGWEGQVIAGFVSVVTTGTLFVYGVTHIRVVAPGSPPVAGWLVGVLIALVFGFGFVAALVLRSSRPDIYAAIGAGQALTPELDPVPVHHHHHHRRGN